MEATPSPKSTPVAPKQRSPWGLVILFVSAVLAVILCAYLGYGYGQQALRDVQTPTTVDLTTDLFDQEKSDGFISEPQILSQVAQNERRMRAQGLRVVDSTAGSVVRDANLETSDIFAAPKVVAAAAKADTQQEATSADLVLRVNTVQKLANQLILEVSLSNNSDKDRRFLYGDAFNQLLVSDEKGKRLSTLTSNLPGDVRADGTTYTGTIEIPIDELGSARYLRLSLQNFPDGQVNLAIPSVKLP